MGAGQSRNALGAEVEVKTSYYELLGVPRQATEEEIKKAYRRKALELHPDRNYGNEDDATKTFAEVQAAYEVLSDAQERAWYDSHESAILRGDDGVGGDDVPAYQNIRTTTADDLARMIRKFNSNVDFSDAPSGFFGFLRETFEQLAKEEEVAANWENVDAPEYPSFGHKDDIYDNVVKRFYAAWSNFSTVKTFAWKDKYRLSEAPDRWYRRRMDQENKTHRKEGIKEFNEAVRALVAFVRKRDPRYIPSTQSEEERQKILRDAAASQAARARAENQAKISGEVPEWAKVREPDELEESEEEEIEQEVFECVACNKVFKSEKQWEAHEKSKKHQKAVYALQKKMRKENAHLDLSDAGMSSGVATPDDRDEDGEEVEVLEDVAAEVGDHEVRANGHAGDQDSPEEDVELDNSEREREGRDEESQRDSAPKDKASKADSENEASENEDSDYASPETIQARLKSTTISEDLDEADSNPGSGQERAKPKLGKAAQKRAKKAAAAAHSASEEQAGTHKCAECNAAFQSKTRLFQHIKDHGHAAPKVVASGGGGKGKKAKGKR